MPVSRQRKNIKHLGTTGKSRTLLGKVGKPGSKLRRACYTGLIAMGRWDLTEEGRKVAVENAK